MGGSPAVANQSPALANTGGGGFDTAAILSQMIKTLSSMMDIGKGQSPGTQSVGQAGGSSGSVNTRQGFRMGKGGSMNTVQGSASLSKGGGGGMVNVRQGFGIRKS